MATTKQHWEGIYQPVVACLGFPIEGNPSQFVLERLAAQFSPEWRFVTLPVTPEDFRVAIAGVRAMHFAGVVLLPPFLENAFDSCDRWTEVALQTNRVRVLRRLGTAWEGHDTFWISLQPYLQRMVRDRGNLQNDQNDDHDSRSMICLCDEPTIRSLRKLFAGFDEAVLTSENRSPKATWQLALVDASLHPTVPRSLMRTQRAEGATLVLLNEHPNNRAWCDYARESGVSIVLPMELIVSHFAETFWYLTGCRSSEASIRDALEEYLNL